jgi:hypothetical protein
MIGEEEPFTIKEVFCLLLVLALPKGFNGGQAANGFVLNASTRVVPVATFSRQSAVPPPNQAESTKAPAYCT